MVEYKVRVIKVALKDSATRRAGLMRVYGTGLTTVEAVEGRYLHGSRRTMSEDGQSWLPAFQKVP